MLVKVFAAITAAMVVLTAWPFVKALVTAFMTAFSAAAGSDGLRRRGALRADRRPGRPAPQVWRCWLPMSLAGIVLGLPLSLLASGLLAAWTPGGFRPEPHRVQFVMWMVAPLWATILALAVLARDGRQAWSRLAVLTLLAAGALGGLRSLAV